MLQGIVVVLQFQNVALSDTGTAFEDTPVEEKLYVSLKSNGPRSSFRLFQE